MSNALKIRLWDIESNGLLEDVSKIHVIVIHDIHAGWYRRYNEKDHGKDFVKKAKACLMESDLICGHNIINYDIPVLDKLGGFSFPKERVLDTLVMSRLLYSNLKDIDTVYLRRGVLPGRLFGSHSLEAWGYRTGVMKDEYQGDPAIEDLEERKARKWEYWNQAMDDYCEIDVQATRAIFDKFITNEYYFAVADTDLKSYLGKVEAVQLEHQVAWLMAKQQRNGFPFDTKGAGELYATLAARRQELLTQVVDTFGSWYKPKGGTEQFRHPRTGKPLPKYPMVKYPKTGELYLKNGKTLSKTPYFKDAPYTPVEWVTFNPGSREHIAKVLMDRGWVPTEFTDTGKPQIDEEVLAECRVPDEAAQAAIELIAEYMLVVKRIGQIAEGDNAWLRHDRDGFIHGSVNPNGAVTGRATHAFPNIAQVPSAGALYGPECRAMFGAKHFRHVWPEAIQVGTDMSGIELRCLGHFMARFDEGAYIDVLLNGDIHWLNVQSLGLVPKGTQRDKDNHQHDAYRNNAKTFIYAFLYGAGDAKIGTITGGGKDEGKRLKTNFMAATPAIADLRASIEHTLVESQKWVAGEMQVKWKRKWLRGLDGRKLHVRSAHSALNTLLQSAGALTAKKWIVRLEELLLEAGYKHGTGKDDDFFFMAWVHDEVQICCRNRAIAEDVSKFSSQAIKEAGEFFNFRCLLEAEAKIGDSWLECH